MKRTRLVVSSSLVLLSLLATVGCSGSTAASDPTSSATAAQTGTKVAAVAPGAKSSRVRMMADALSSVPLRDDQRAEIEKLATDADARHAAATGAHEDIVKTLAAQIEAGKIDRPALQAKIDAAADAANVAHPADQAAIQRLHALLTPEQRGQVAYLLEARAHAHTHQDGMHGEHAHGAHMDRMHQWATDLKLTDAQQEQIKAIFANLRAAHAAEHGEGGAHGADMKAMHEHGGGKAFVESFRSETLTLPAPLDAHVIANRMADHFVGVAQAVLPILTPEQRALAAAKLREHASEGAGHGEMPLGE